MHNKCMRWYGNLQIVANNNNMAMSIHKKRQILTLMSLCYLLIPGIVSLIGFILFYSAVFFIFYLRHKGIILSLYTPIQNTRY